MLVPRDRLAIDADGDFARDRELEAGGGNDHVGVEMLARFELDAGLVEAFDMIGDDRGLARLHRFEKVGIGDKAEPLVPRIIGRGESDGIVTVAERLLQLLGQEVRNLFRLFARAAENDVLKADILETRQPVGGLFGQDLAQEIGESVLCRTDGIPGRRALQHRHMRGLVRH